MAKEEARLIKANPRVEEYPFEIYQDLCFAVSEIIEGLDTEIKLLQQNCEELSRYFFENDAPDLIELRNTLEETRNHLSRQNYSLAYKSKLYKIRYGDDYFK